MVKSFSQSALETIGKDKLDILLLNAGVNKAAEEPGINGSQWCEAYLVNHLSKDRTTPGTLKTVP